jgi:inosine-uridine nucleoside N-ribohydrolase
MPSRGRAPVSHGEAVFVDSDNALGSARGDVDDGIAIAVLLASGAPVQAFGSVFGNAPVDEAQRNNAALAELFRSTAPSLRGAARPGDADTAVAAHLGRALERCAVLALGPLTNVAAALDRGTPLEDARARVICLGSNATTAGRWPPLWPFEFNFTKDRSALVRTFASRLELTVVPLDQAVRLRVPLDALDAIDGSVGTYLRTHARRWWVRARRLKRQATAPVWDLVAVAYLLWPERFLTRRIAARAHQSGWVQYGAGEREVTLITDYDAREIWQTAVATLNRAASEHGAA